MARIKAMAVALAVTGAAWASQAAEVGQAAPDFKVKDCCGQEVKLADQKGKVVVLEWFNPGCPFVKKHYDGGDMQKLQATYTAKGVVWYRVATSAAGKPSPAGNMEASMKYTQDQGVKSTGLLIDEGGAVAQSYGAKTTPHMFIIDPGGKLVYAGAIDDDTAPKYNPQAKNYVAAALDEVLAGKPVSTAATKPYGCSVKYR